LSAQPNAGLPREVHGRKMYMASPEYMGKFAGRLIRAGARFIGGCCGTTPDHVKRMADAMHAVAPRHVNVHVAAPAVSRDDDDATTSLREPAPLAQRSNWGRRLAAGELATTVEIVPPRGISPDR